MPGPQRVLVAGTTADLWRRMPAPPAANDQAPCADPRSTRAHVTCDQAVVLEDRNGHVGDAQPQGLADQRERRRVQHVVELHMAVPMKQDLMPGTEIGSDWRQAAHQRLLEQETFKWLGNPPEN